MMAFAGVLRRKKNQPPTPPRQQQPKSTSAPAPLPIRIHIFLRSRGFGGVGVASVMVTSPTSMLSGSHALEVKVAYLDFAALDVFVGLRREPQVIAVDHLDGHLRGSFL